MKHFIITCGALVALAVMSTSDAEAGKISYSYGFGTGSTTYVGSTYFTTYPKFRRLGPVYPVRTHVWHNTSHWDYVPSSVSLTPFGLRYNPGRYVWHNDGHFDPVIGHGHLHHH